MGRNDQRFEFGCFTINHQDKQKGNFIAVIFCMMFYAISLVTDEVMFFINQWDSGKHSARLKFIC